MALILKIIIEIFDNDFHYIGLKNDNFIIFFKSFVVTDEKAIEQFLYDLENAKPRPAPPPRKEQPSVDEMLKILEKRLASKSQET